MFGIGIPELIIIFIVALIFIGPKRLPDLARTLAKAVVEFRGVAEGVRKDLDIEGMLAEEKEKLLRDYEKAAEDMDETGEDREGRDAKWDDETAMKTKATRVEESEGGNDLRG